MILVLIQLHSTFHRELYCFPVTHRTQHEFGILRNVTCDIVELIWLYISKRDLNEIKILLWKIVRRALLHTCVNCNALRIFTRCPWWCYPRWAIYYTTWFFSFGPVHAWIDTQGIWKRVCGLNLSLIFLHRFIPIIYVWITLVLNYFPIEISGFY